MYETKLNQKNWSKVKPTVIKLLGLKAEQCSIPMRDGVHLSATLYTPKKGASWPVIVHRNPYVVGDVSYLAGAWKNFVDRGYALLDVQVRGSQTSEGEWLPMLNEREDGRAVIDWVGEQPWCNGNIGTYGGSYCGYTQWAILDYDHPMLKTHFISVFGNDPMQMHWWRGMFRQEISTMWAAQMMGENRMKIMLGKGADELYREAYAVKPQTELGEQLMGEPCDWYKSWVTSPDPKAPLWDKGTFGDIRRLSKDVKRPVCFHGGWYDIFNRMELEGYRSLPKKVREESRFVIGPWEHHGMSGGDLKFKDGGKYGLLGNEIAYDWFGHYLKGEPLEGECGMEAYCIGEGKWHQIGDDLTASSKKSYYFGRKGLEEKAPKKGALNYTYDPENPVESRGGMMIANNQKPGGTVGPCSLEQQKPGYRDDVLSFVSPKLKKSMTISGSMHVELYVSSSAPATAFTINVMEVMPNGKTYNIREDITDIRFKDRDKYEDYKPGDCRKLTFDLNDIFWKVQKGSKLRVDISSSNFPAYHVHPNTTTVWGESTTTQTAEQTVFFGGRKASKITIPVK